MWDWVGCPAKAALFCGDPRLVVAPRLEGADEPVASAGPQARAAPDGAGAARDPGASPAPRERRLDPVGVLAHEQRDGLAELPRAVAARPASREPRAGSAASGVAVRDDGVAGERRRRRRGAGHGARASSRARGARAASSVSASSPVRRSTASSRRATSRCSSVVEGVDERPRRGHRSSLPSGSVPFHGAAPRRDVRGGARARGGRAARARASAERPRRSARCTTRNAFELARRDGPVGAVHRRARERGHAGAVRAVSRRPAALAGAPRDDVERLIRTTGSSAPRRGTSRALRGARRALRRRGAPEMDAPAHLPGVGRKTANVVRSVAFGEPGLPVDTHVTAAQPPPRPVARQGPRRDRAVPVPLARARAVGRVQHPDDPARPGDLHGATAARATRASCVDLCPRRACRWFVTHCTAVRRCVRQASGAPRGAGGVAASRRVLARRRPAPELVVLDEASRRSLDERGDAGEQHAEARR